MANIFKKLFGEHGAKNVVTLFHKPSVPASTRVHTILKQANAHAVGDVKEDQAEKNEFELDVTEAPPTSDQLKNILEYLGGPTSATVGKLIRGANDQADAFKRLEKDGDAFQRPVVVNWHLGKAVAGDNESEILSLLRSIPKEDGKA